MHFIFKFLFIFSLCVPTFAESQSDVVEYIQELTGKVDTLTQKVQELEMRLQILENQLHVKATDAKDSGASTNNTQAQTPDPAKAKTPPAGADRLWADAMAAIQQKNFELAEQKISDFVHFYPDHTHAPEGYYWLGELRLLSNNYLQAQTYYALAYKGFLESDTRKADAGLKIAECYFALDKNKEGCLFLKEIMKLKGKGAAVSTATLKLMDQYWAQHQCGQ